MSRFGIFSRALVMSILTLAIACSQANRFRILSFFFDGVPQPGSQASDVAPADGGGRPDGKPAEEPFQSQQIARAPVQHAHPPYKQGRCGTCHNVEDGQLFKSPQEGLCSTCHGPLTRDPIYLHGPVAANDCLFCHHHHASPYSKILLREPNETCGQCHDPEDLTEGVHHATIERETCIACHDPHGGDNKLFLKLRMNSEPGLDE